MVSLVVLPCYSTAWLDRTAIDVSWLAMQSLHYITSLQMYEHMLRLLRW